MHWVRILAGLLAFAYTTPAVTAQTAQLRFEVASVHHRADNSGPTDTQIAPGGRFVAANAPLRVLILFAWQYMPWQVSGGPDWVNFASFDIHAKPEGRASDQEIRLMLQNLLKDRFALRTTQVMRDLPVYVLALDKSGPRLKASRDPNGEPRITRGPLGQTVFRSVRVSQLVNFLSLRLSRNVIDETGMKGAYDFDFAWTPDLPRRPGGIDSAQPADSEGPSVFSAARDQLGLTLKSVRRPVPALMIESAGRPSDD